VAELRSFIFLSRLQPQTMCYLGTWIRGSLPRRRSGAKRLETCAATCCPSRVNLHSTALCE